MGHHFTHKRDLPIGTTNEQGKVKVKDPETGAVKWVGARKGLLYDYAGGVTGKKLEQEPPMSPHHTAHFSK